MNITAAHLIQSKTVKQTLSQLWQATNENGRLNVTPKARVKYLDSVTISLENPTDATDRFPYWDQQSEQWYLSTFVDPKNGPPEKWQYNIIFPFTYGWRAHFHDHGWGHVLHLVNILHQLNYSELPVSRKEDLDAFIKETYHLIHPDVLMSIIAWHGKRAIEGYLIQPEFLQHIVGMSRTDMMNVMVKHLQDNPGSRNAITTSFMYGRFDHQGITDQAPEYQNFQAAMMYDENSNPLGLETFHHQRTLDASGPGQLDIAQDIYWGSKIAGALNVPLIKTNIHTNYAYLVEKGQKEQTNISLELMAKTDGYVAGEYDIEQRLKSPMHKLKVEYTLGRLIPTVVENQF